MQKMITRRTVALRAAQEFSSIHPVLQQVYAARGVQCAQELERGLEHLLPYADLLNIESATECLYQALVSQQRIMIVGDFDVDGATSTTVAVLALRALGARHVHYIVPNRFLFGYGLTPEIVDAAIAWRPDVLVTVDNGIASGSGVAHAKQLGLKVIITDHHLPGDELPAADAIVNPNQSNDRFPSKNLAGVGVIFYVMLALRSYLRERQWFVEQGIAEPNMGQFLDLVALGTVADVVPLDRNNRVLVHQGLARMRAGNMRPGIQALFEVAKRDPRRLIASDLGFVIAPRLNAAGRLEDMSLGIECLLTKDVACAHAIASQLNQLNEERRSIEAEMQQQALKAIDKLQRETANAQHLPAGVCLFDETWHQGVIGIVAGRMKERLSRPVIAFAPVSPHELKGSARSIPQLHIRDALDVVAKRHPELIVKFGGHAMAAGLSIQREHFQAFSQAFAQVVGEQLTEEALRGVIHSDGELTESQLSLDLAALLRESGPWGATFPEPLFDGPFQVRQQRLVGGKHLKLVVSLEGSQRFFDAIAFNVDLNQWPNHRCERIHAAYRLDINEYRGNQDLQLVLEHIAAV